MEDKIKEIQERLRREFSEDQAKMIIADNEAQEKAQIMRTIERAQGIMGPRRR